LISGQALNIGTCDLDGDANSKKVDEGMLLGDLLTAASCTLTDGGM